jgi:tRNA(Ile)-lysidine synthase
MVLNKVRKTIVSYGLVNKGDKIILGVSGGPDSLALLYLLNSLKKEFSLSLHVAHLDHMLRIDSGNDAEFVKGVCGKLKLPVTVEKIDVKGICAGLSLEEAARNVRLGFFCKLAEKIKADKIALGHNFDDQAETVLMRILRGSGLYGLSGIQPKRKIHGFWIVRPLLEVKRREIEAYLRQKRLKPRRDISNEHEIYLRNKIRHKLIPLLEKEYNRNIREVLSNMAQSIVYDYDFLSLTALRKMKGMKSKISVSILEKLHPALRRLILRQAICNVKGDTRRIGFQHIREIEDLISNRPLSSVVDLPKGISVAKKKDTLLFYLR